jgi:hypothetical protein
MAELESVEAYLDGKDSVRSSSFAPSRRPSRMGPVRGRPAQLDRLLEAQADLRGRVRRAPSSRADRLRITQAVQLDDELAALVTEAYETVGPGTRSISRA